MSPAAVTSRRDKLDACNRSEEDFVSPPRCFTIHAVACCRVERIARSSRAKARGSFCKRHRMTSPPSRKHLSPQEVVAEHAITKEMQRLGATTVMLEATRFTRREGLPFDSWAVWGAPDLPVEAIHLLKPYATLKWLLIDEPPASRDREDAYRYIEVIQNAPLLAKARNDLAAKRANIESATAVRRKYTPEQRQCWKDLAASPKLAPLSKSRKAVLIAKHCGLPQEAINTIRLKI